MSDICFVTCPACEGEGFHLYDADIDRTTGAVMEQFVRCDTCGGTGEVEQEAQPVTLADLDALAEEEGGLQEERRIAA